MNEENHLCRIISVNVYPDGILVDAQDRRRPSVAYTNIPIMTGFSGLMAVPEEDQRCIVAETPGGFEYVKGVFTEPDRADGSLKENEFVLQMDPSTKVSFREDGSGGYDAHIEASGDIYVGANGQKVAVQDHTHTESGGGTTSTPNEAGTNTEIK